MSKKTAKKSAGKTVKTQILTESALAVALSAAIFTLSDLIPWPFPYGGGFTLFGQVPIIIVSYRRGIKNGLAAALVLAVFEMIMGYKNFSYVKGVVAYFTVAFLDYIIAFGCLGFGGTFKGKLGGKQSKELALGGAAVCVIRFACHFLSGVTIWKGYCPDGTAVALYSLIYNGSYMSVELVLTVVGLLAAGKILKLDAERIF